MGVDKGTLRQQFTKLRHTLSPATRDASSRQIVDFLTQLPEYPTSRRIGIYAATPGEVDLRSFFDRCTTDGKSCYFPRVEGADMAFHQVRAWSELVSGKYGILAPHPSSVVLAPEEFDLLVVPGVAFDRHGHRLGRGKGFYDRYLPRVGGCHIGACFDSCVVETLPHEPHDARIHLLVTESGVLRFQGGV